MSFESAFLELMPYSVTRKAFLRRSTDGYGTPAYAAAASTYRARVLAKPTLVKQPDGQEMVATHTMWLATTATISQQDQITFDGSTFQIVEVGRYPDGAGMHHVRLLCRGG